ncbi:MAG: hypothetical protein ABL907_03290 [Hyphomicrobium sp.]
MRSGAQEREKLIPRINETTGPRLAKMLAKFKDHPIVGEVRSIGLLGAIELTNNKKKRTRFANPGRVGLICRNHFFNNGFIMRAVWDTMVCAPPLIWDEEHFVEAEKVIQIALDATWKDVKHEVTA